MTSLGFPGLSSQSVSGLRGQNVVESLIRYTKGLRILRSPAANETELLQSCSGNAAFWSQMPEGSQDKTAGKVGEFWEELKLQMQAQDWHHDALIWQFLLCFAYRNSARLGPDSGGYFYKL